MARSSKKLGRLVHVFHDLATVERARVAELAREIEAVRESQNAIFRQLEQPSSFAGPFMSLHSARIGRNERLLGKLTSEHAAALSRFTAASARERSASALAADARAEEARKSEQRALEDLLEFQQGAAQGRGKSATSE